jgi:hypothetical protein
MWAIEREAREAADEVYYDQLRPIEVSGFGAGLLNTDKSVPFLPEREERDLYADSLFDLHRLLEEVRFETALAVMILVDFRLRRDRGEVEPFKEDRSVANVVMPVEILATLAPYMRPPPSPTALLTSPHEQLSGSRHLSRWYAAQLLDGAVLRALSCLDRVITMLHLRALLPIEHRKDGTIRLPSFERTALRRLRPAYQHSPDWAPFRAIADNAIYKLMKRFRDGTVHHRRWPSELHGEKQITYWDSGGPSRGLGAAPIGEGLSAQDHAALLLATWDQVLRPAIEGGGRLLDSAQGAPTGDESAP